MAKGDTEGNEKVLEYFDSVSIMTPRTVRKDLPFADEIPQRLRSS